jgi:hypothetical protein
MCGAVRYEVDAPLELAGYCHCTRCQRRTGGGSAISAKVQPGSFRIARGEERVKLFSPENGFEKAFCGECGSALFSRNPADHEHISVRMGTFDSDPGIRPSYRQFLAYAAPWEPLPEDDLTRFPERRTT